MWSLLDLMIVSAGVVETWTFEEVWRIVRVFPVFLLVVTWVVMVYPTVGDGPNQSHPKINQRMVWVDVEFYSLFLGRFFANITNGCYGSLDVKCDTLNSLNHIDHIDIDYH